MATSDSRKTVRIGVFIPTEAQLLDTACIDVFGSMSYEYQSGLSYMIPETIYSLAPSVSISYISTIKPGELIRLTGSMKVACTHHLSDPEVQPGQLDIVLIPGPDPRTAWEAAVTDWVAGHAATEGTDILSVCSGIFVCGAAGILKGKKACGPRGLQSQLKKQFEDVTWLGDELRWIQDGNIWSSGGVTNGNDLVSAYARQSHHFPRPVVEVALAATEVGDRPQEYGPSKTPFFAQTAV